MSARFPILQKPIRASVENVEKYVLACLALHNFLHLTDDAHYTPAGFIHLKDKHGSFVPGQEKEHKIKMQLSLVAFKVSMLFEVSVQVLIR